MAGYLVDEVIMTRSTVRSVIDNSTLVKKIIPLHTFVVNVGLTTISLEHKPYLSLMSFDMK